MSNPTNTLRWLIPLFLAAQTNLAFSQTDNQKNSQSIDFAKLGSMVPGELVYKDGTIRKAYILYANPSELIRLNNTLEVAFMGMEANSIINKEDLDAFTVDGHTWKRITYKDDLQFGIVHIDGAIMNFSIFKIPVVRQTGDYIEEVFWQKLEEEPIRATVFLMKYKKTLLTLIADNAELTNKVTNGEPGYKGVLNAEKIVKEYNQWYYSLNNAN